MIIQSQQTGGNSSFLLTQPEKNTAYRFFLRSSLDNLTNGDQDSLNQLKQAIQNLQPAAVNYPQIDASLVCLIDTLASESVNTENTELCRSLVQLVKTRLDQIH